MHAAGASRRACPHRAAGRRRQDTEIATDMSSLPSRRRAGVNQLYCTVPVLDRGIIIESQLKFCQTCYSLDLRRRNAMPPSCDSSLGGDSGSRLILPSVPLKGASTVSFSPPQPASTRWSWDIGVGQIMAALIGDRFREGGVVYSRHCCRHLRHNCRRRVRHRV
jgi:hypothetical protein